MTASSTPVMMEAKTAPPTAPSGASVAVESQNASAPTTISARNTYSTAIASRGSASAAESVAPVGSLRSPQPYAAVPTTSPTAGSSTTAAAENTIATVNLRTSSRARGTGAASR